MSEKKIKEEFSDLIQQVSRLESRISVLEESLGSAKPAELIASMQEKKTDQEFGVKNEDHENGFHLEANIGEYGLAWFGNIVLFFGGIFLHLFIQSKGYPLYAALTGYAFVVSMILFAKKIQKSYTYLSSVFGLFAKFLLFYVTAGLHFLTEYPLVESKYMVIGLLLVLVLFQVYQSVKLKSEKHLILGLFFILITAILSNETHILLPLLTLTAAGSVYFMFHSGWSKTLIYTILLVYFSFLIWVLGNPFVNSSFSAVSENQFSEYYLFAIAALFSLVFFVKLNESNSNGILLFALILNGLGFSFLLAMLTSLFFSSNYQMLFAFISIFCILYSILLKKYSPWKYSPALYAVYGFVAISITFYGILKFPMIFLTLALQSLLVVSMALWFRSRIIVVLNTLMFIVLTIVYFGFFDHVSIINFSFPVVAAFSARIIHWQQERLTLRSQNIRHLYLTILFFTLLYALKMALPGEYVTLSWSIVALVYFGLSIILKLKKYRYLAIATLGATSVYLFFVDLATIDVIYRIIAFLVLAVISIGISLYYVEKSRHKNLESEAGEKK
jgi:hypothetical protein